MLAPGSGYLSYRTRDLGYGIEEGNGDYVFTGEIDSVGKHTFQPATQGEETIYLFEDEIQEWIRTF